MKLKLTLKSRHSSIVHSLNGKSYRLNPGVNVLNLNEDDYNALTKALGIKVNKESLNKCTEEQNKSLTKEDATPSTIQEDSCKPEEDNNIVDDNKEEPIEDLNNAIDKSEDNACDFSVDYDSMTYNELKAEYKKVTGENCKLKKADVIAFLQEHSSNV